MKIAFVILLLLSFVRPGICQSTDLQSNSTVTEIINLHKIVPVTMVSKINSKFARTGDQVIVKLKENLYHGRSLVAHQDAILKGTIISCRYARTLTDSFQGEGRFKSDAAIGIKLDQLIIDKEKTFTITAKPVHQESTRIGSDGFTYGVIADNEGKIVQAGRMLSKEQTDSYNVLRVATNAPVPGGILVNLAAGPAVMGAVGAASPDVAFSKPLDPEVKHKRLKGMAYGVVTNLPGACVVQAMVQKGSDVILNTGDEFMIDLIISNQALQRSTLVAKAEALSVTGEITDDKPKSPHFLPATLPNKRIIHIHDKLPSAKTKSGVLPLKPYINN